jgi:hypothetical protein
VYQEVLSHSRKPHPMQAGSQPPVAGLCMMHTLNLE